MNTVSSGFKLIAIRSLEDCNDNITKCLQKEETYYFSNDYEISEDGNRINFRQSNLKSLSNQFFSLNDKKGEGERNKKPCPLISISAIVGKNGDGKSSLIELMIRLINNCAQYYRFNTNNHPLLKVEGVKAALYYKINDEIFRLKEDCLGPAICRIGKIVYSNDEKEEKYEIEHKNEKIEEEKIKKEFFYTMISNYSHYAYNIYDFTREWDKAIKKEDDNEKCWLFRIFHKNDGYQTPLVLHPYRNKGNIDINTEKYLSSQRLLALFINAANFETNKSSFRNVNNQYAELLFLRDSGDSKLQERLIKDYFKEISKTSVLDDVIDSLEDKIKEIKETENIISNLKDIEKEIIKPLNLIWERTIKPNEKVFVTISKWLFKTKNKDLAKSKTDLAILLKSLQNLATFLKEKKEQDNFKSVIIGKINDVIDLYSSINYYSFNLLQIQRIDLIDHICDIWRKKKEVGNYAFNLNDELLVKDYRELSWLEKSYHYIVYKTIQILDRYPNYDNSCNAFNDQPLGFSDSSSLVRAKKTLNKGFKTLLNDIEDNKSHITLKLRQTLNFKAEIEKNENIYAEIQENTSVNRNIKRSLIEQEQDNKKIKENDCFVLGLDALKKYYKTNVIALDSLPPPIFQSNIYLKQTKENEHYTPMSALSSGEKQMLNSVSAIVYHLQNINSTPDGLIKYTYANLILEEIELYFHPEYQRSFIKKLLELLYSANLDKIKGINIIFVTHSPFILSDIPKRNVLFLKEGRPTHEMQENTFGANIHSLLKNGFFLDTLPIGDFARNKINSLFEKLNTGDFSKEEFKQMYQNIILVGEPYLRGQLLSLYNSYQLPKTEFEREEAYERKMAILEKEINELKKILMKKNLEND